VVTAVLEVQGEAELQVALEEETMCQTDQLEQMDPARLWGVEVQEELAHVQASVFPLAVMQVRQMQVLMVRREEMAPMELPVD